MFNRGIKKILIISLLLFQFNFVLSNTIVVKKENNQLINEKIITLKKKILEIKIMILKRIIYLKNIEKKKEWQGEKLDQWGSNVKGKVLLFKSGFENGVYLEKERSEKDGIWWQNIKGSDVDGFSWPIKILEGKGSLQMIISENKDIKRYIKNKIENIKDNNGKKTRALHQIISKKEKGDTQDPYIIYTNGKEVKDLYIKYSLMLPKNIKELLGRNGWMVLSEYKTTGDYRLAFYIYEDENGELYWYVHGDNEVSDPRRYKEFWHRENHKVKVPIDEWFDVELSWHRSEKKDGHVWWAINKETIVDYYGPTKIKDPINAIMVFTNYASSPIHQWVDNLEIFGSKKI